MDGFDAVGGLGVALVLGLKHGLDADHLAAIDGLARLQAAAGRPRLARCSGLLFALGHGAIVLLAAALLQGHVDRLPNWLDRTGQWISIGMLTLLGIANLRQALAGDGAPVAGVVAPWLMRLRLAGRAWGGMVVGALFAISFDTLAIAGWFGVTAAQRGGGAVATMAAVFVLGMVLSDAANGWLTAGLLQRSGRARRGSARLFQVAVAGLALPVALLGALRATWPAVDAWADGRELTFGLAVVATVLLGFAWTMRPAARRCDPG